MVDAWVEHKEKQVFFVVKMTAEETKPDLTTASGTDRRVMYTAPAGRRITSIDGEKNWPGLVSFYDTNHEVDNFNTPQVRSACLATTGATTRAATPRLSWPASTSQWWFEPPLARRKPAKSPRHSDRVVRRNRSQRGDAIQSDENRTADRNFRD